MSAGRTVFGFTFARITGGSMEPMLPDGSLALFRRKPRVERGDVVLVDHPEFGTIVKRVREVASGDQIQLEGTAQQSTSAERLGRVSLDRVRGTMVSAW